MNEIDIHTLKGLIRYDPESGTLVWRERTPELMPDDRYRAVWNKRYAGQTALKSVKDNGYLYGRIFDRNFYAHRVAYALHNGRWPENLVDHINGDKTDNRAANLREVTKSGNAKNMVRRQTRNHHTGVYRDKRHGTWVAQISRGGKMVHIGSFSNEHDATVARRRAQIGMGFSERHGLPLVRDMIEAQE